MKGVFTQIAGSALLTLGALFPIVNPLGNAPIFFALTRGLTGKPLAQLTRSIALNSFALLLASLFIGTLILGFFGISVPVVQVGGGLVVVSTGWALLQRPDEDSGERVENLGDETNYMRQAFYPFTLPLTVGPGAISVAITVGANRAAGPAERWPGMTGLVIGAGVIAASVYLSYRFAERIAYALGETTMNIAVRLSSFILVCIGVQIIWNGVSELLRSVLAR
ncbi:MAG: MarC family protein [Bryobacterales bacterium]|nr:MarC family protein [Bryobacterales bacterium]MBV9400309.1 MarC family protein [Bryobacterales bacterium]